MIVDQARALLAQGEGLMVEFKSIQAGKLGNSVFETVSAFSNRYGGHILMGVADDGTVQGIPANQVDGLKRNFAKMVSNPEVVHPPLSLPLEEVTVDGKLILALYVPAHSQPVRFGPKTFDRAEDGDTNITDNAHLMAALYQRKALQHTERTLFPLITARDLRLAELMPVVRQRAVNKRAMNGGEGHPWGDMTDTEIMRSAGLIETDPATGQECFNLAAVLLSCRGRCRGRCRDERLSASRTGDDPHRSYRDGGAPRQIHRHHRTSSTTPGVSATRTRTNPPRRQRPLRPLDRHPEIET